MDKLSIAVQEVGGDQVLAQSISKSNTALEALQLCQKNSVNIGNHIAKQAKEVVLTVLTEDIAVNIFIFDRDGLLIGTSDEL
jgi:Cobalamin biosynthesis protein CbiD